MQRWIGLCAVLAVVAVAATGCKGKAEPGKPSSPGKVVLYTSIDDPYVRPLVERFERQTGTKVTLVTDSEATKTAGLVEKLEAEKDSPHADVYWGNEIFHTINLAHKGVFAPYQSEAARDVPARWRDKDGLYTDIGMRARVIGFSTRPQYKQMVAGIKGIGDLANPALKGKVAICHPGFGTASGHIAALYVVLGPQKFEDLMRSLKANDIKLLGGNSVVIEQVAAGTIAAGPTDNDDVQNSKAENLPVDGVVPDQDTFGTLLIPTTVALVKGGPNTENAKKLIDFLLAAQVEKELIDGRYLAYSVRDAEKHVKAMNVDYVEVARQMKHAEEVALSILQGR